MLKERIKKIKSAIPVKEEGNNKKVIENLVVFVIILIVTIVVINYIWKDNKDNSEVNTNFSSDKVLAEQKVNVIEEKFEETGIEGKLKSILSNISGVGNVEILITYSQTSTIIPMYSEDSSQTTTQETDSGGGTRVVNEISSKKDIIYEENNGLKSPMTQSVINPKIEGAIITAQGASNYEIKTNIITAVEAATGLPTHKIQVFEMP